ncbi:MAG: DUF370 domain-containing protein [Clostridia bacterium]
MYLHIGGDHIIRQEEIIGVFDMENTTVSSVTREYLKDNEKTGRTFFVNRDMPKAFILTERKKQCRIYFTSISSGTLKKRMEERMEPYKNETGGKNDEF